MIHTSDNLASRSWYSADSAELTRFGDCVRWKLNWFDGAFVYCLEDTEDQARAELRRYGFDA